MSEKEETALQLRIQTLIERRGGWVAKQHGSMIVRPGIPDLLICYKGRFIGMEVKVKDNTPSKQQGIELRNILKSGGITCVVWSKEQAEFLLNEIDKLDIREPNKLLHNINIDTGEKW